MDFVNRPYIPGETIAAIATPPGEGGVAIIRISGRAAIAVASHIFSAPVSTFKTHTAHLGNVVDSEGNPIDQALLLVMRAPKSYTGEDTVEIHCHGGSLISRQVLETVLKAGARAALPGEFTFRAYINGKIDLAQAEAVQQLIGAKNGLALQMAEQQLQGALSKKIATFQKELVEIAAILEAWVDFPEEGLEFASQEEILRSLKETGDKMRLLHATFHEGKIAQEGLSLCLFGAPNVGKSSLMNALAGKERAIVTPIAGTTRDLIETEIRLGGLHFNLIDTAGIRETEEVIEVEGIRRTREALQKADLLLLILDASRPITAEERTMILHAPQEKTLLLWNKTDLEPAPLEKLLPHTLSISAKNLTGLEEVREAITRLIWKNGPPPKEEVVLTQARHFQALGQAITSLEALMEGLEAGISPEFLSADMRQTLIELGTIIGTNITEEILSSIFSKFCVGK